MWEGLPAHSEEGIVDRKFQQEGHEKTCETSGATRSSGVSKDPWTTWTSCGRHPGALSYPSWGGGNDVDSSQPLSGPRASAGSGGERNSFGRSQGLLMISEAFCFG